MSAGYSALLCNKSTKAVSWSGDNAALVMATHGVLKNNAVTKTVAWHISGNIGTGDERLLVINRTTKAISWDVGTNWTWV